MVISLSSPLQIGLYKENKLFEKFSYEEHTSEALPKAFESILKKYNIKRIFFAKGPGSFMAIKITYIFLRTLAITKNISLYANDGFYFSKNQPIKAMKKMYFVKKDDKITTQFFQDTLETKFFLPQIIEFEKFSQDIEPLYILPAV